MELSMSDKKVKELMKEIMVEMIKENREGFYDLITEAIEEVGLANAIKEGRRNKFVSEDKILDIIKE